MSPASPHATRAWVEIDLPAIDRNVGRIKQAMPPHVRYVAVVKANAYGHGMPEVVTRLLQAGVDCFAVANVDEAARLREVGHEAEILLLSPTLPSEMPRAIALDLDVTLNSRDEAQAVERCAAAAGRQVCVHIKVDTGMGRAGVWHANARELIAYVRTAPHLDWRGLYTHFSEADADTDFTAEQRRIFWLYWPMFRPPSAPVCSSMPTTAPGWRVSRRLRRSMRCVSGSCSTAYRRPRGLSSRACGPSRCFRSTPASSW